MNGDWTAFDVHTVRMMIRMFDSDRSGTIGFDEFCGLSDAYQPSPEAGEWNQAYFEMLIANANPPL